jgi:cobalt/nickel transport system permease protein
MAGEHALFFGWVEALATMGVVAALGASSMHLLDMKPASKPMRWVWAILGVMILATPIGVLAGGTAWGEWSPQQLKASLGYVPSGLARLGPTWTAAMPGYAPAFVRSPTLGYLLAAVAGVALIAVVTWLAGRLLFAGAGSARNTGRKRSLARRTADAVGAAVAEVIENEQLASAPGILQRLDPRAKLLALGLVAVTASFAHSAAVLGGMVLATLALAAISRVPVASFARKVWGSAGVFGAMLALPAATFFVTPGRVVVPLGPLSLTAPGLLAAASLVLRVVASAGFALLVIWTTRWTDVLAALSAMRVPDVVVATLAMTQKQILALMRTVEQLHLARESRTLSAGTAAENRQWVVGRMAFVVRKSIKTADDVYDAMLARGFTGTMRSLSSLSATASDWTWFVLVALTCAASLGIDRMVMSR